MLKKSFIRYLLALIFSVSCSCGDVHNQGASSSDSSSTQVDTIGLQLDTSRAPLGNSGAQSGASSMQVDSVVKAVPPRHRATGSRSPASVPEEVSVAKGTAMVYSPANMIKDVPSIVNAVISKEDISAALSRFTDAVSKQNPEVKKEDIDRDVKADTIDIYQHMGVKLEFDSSDFREVEGDENVIKDFTGKNSLEWEWVLKPLRSTRKSVLSFMFYYVNPDNNQRQYIMEKTISVVVRVDARSFVDKWGDFLLDDPKTTITAILIPIITFIGGLVFGKGKKKS